MKLIFFKSSVARNLSIEHVAHVGKINNTTVALAQHKEIFQLNEVLK